MHKEIKDKWVVALRSGKYTQTTYNLRQNLPSVGCKHCAIGVLCDLAVKEGIETESVFGGISATKRMINWLGLEEDFGEVSLLKPVDGYLSIMALNDRGHYTFSQIADIIDQQF